MMQEEKEKNIEAGGVDDLDKWLGVTSARTAKWYSSTFHNITAMVGAGVLSLPYAMSELGWGPGVTVMVLSWIITFYTLWQLVEMHEIVPGKRFDRYQELGQHAFGEKLGLYIVVPQQLVVQCGTNIVYMVTGGKCFKKFIETAWPHAHKIKTTYYIMMFGAVQLVVSHLPSLNSILWVSVVAAAKSVCYSFMAWMASIHKGLHSDSKVNVNYARRASTETGGFFQFLSALGDVAFAYAGHSVVLEIQASIPSEPGKPSKKAMWKGCVIAYIIVALCYFPVSMIGYWAFGNEVEDNILMSVKKPAWLVAAANLFVVIHVVGSYQVYAQLVFDMIESFLVTKMKLKPSVILRTVSRSIYVALTMFLGMTFPFFGALLGFFGGFAFAPTTFFLPCICWLIICKPKPFSLSWMINWICIILGVALMIFAPIGALRQIVLAAKDYKFYS